MPKRVAQSPFDRLLSHIVKKDGCWKWNGYKDPGGYGRLMMPGGPIRAHRLSYIFHCGPIPCGKYVLHRCDNPECTNPDHLYVGSHADNMADKVSRGRAYTGSHAGELHGMSKLKETDVRMIRASAEPNPVLARKFGVTPSAIGLIKRRKTWSHLT